MDREKSIENIKKIRKLIVNAEQINDMDFRVILEDIIKKGDDNTEYAVIKYMKSIEIGVNVRLNIIRAIGYLHHPAFLEPLKKIIETENNVHLKKEAIISVAKYNDRRALNILNLALKDLRNSILLQTLNNEIGKIKKNNPVLTLMPRFINEKDNYKSFRVTIDILKRILSEKDSLAFIKFLSFKETKVQDAAFEILCSAGSDNINATIYETFFKRSFEIECIIEEECDEFLSIVNNLHTYLERFPSLVYEKLYDLENVFIMIKDIRIRYAILNIIALCKDEKALEILERMYEKHEKFRSNIVLHLGNNPKSLSFLFDVYKSNELKNEDIIIPLLKIDEGVKYFFDYFEEKDYDEQEIILKYFPLFNNIYYVDFCRNVLKSNHYNLKIMLLEKIQERGEFSVKDILFDPDNEKEFFLMEKEYLATILKLFPISAVKKIFEIIVFEEFSVTKTKRFLKLLEPVLSRDIVFSFDDPPILNYLSNRIVNMNNNDLNIVFLSVFSNLKVISPKSFNDLNVALNIFVNQRGNKTNVKEKYEIRKIKENLTNLSIIKKRVENMERSLRILKTTESLSIEKITTLIIENSLSIPFFIDELCELIKKHFLLADFNKISAWINFFETYPQITNRLKETILLQSSNYNDIINKDLVQLYEIIPEKSRIILKFKNKELIATLLDQFNEIIPDIRIIYEDTIINNTDIIFCDAESFKEMLQQGDFPTKYVFLFLNKISEFAEYKSHNPRFFVKPYSFFRILKDILSELFLISGKNKIK